MNKILVTGGAGFIGSSVVSSLMVSNKYQVTVFDNFSTGHLDNIERWLGSPNFKLIRGDMLESHSLEQAINNCDTVCHFAANPIVMLGDSDTRIDFEQNLLATYNLLEAMRKSPSCKRIMFTSTSAIYGEADIIPTSEKYSPVKPISLYGATKLACEALISGYCYMFNISCIVVRLANVIGSISRHGVIYDFITKLRTNQAHLDILGNGKQNKSYLHIDDCISGLKLLLGILGQTRFEVFNMGSDDAITVLEIADIIINELSLNSVEKRFMDRFGGRGWNGDVKEYSLDCSKLKSTGWRAELGSKDAVVRSVRQYLGVKSYQ